MAPDNESGDDGEERETLPYVGISPHTRVKGRIPEDRTRFFYGDTLSENDAQNDKRFGLVLEDPEVVRGTLFRNAEKPADGTMDEVIDEDSSRATDYRIADEGDKSTTIVKESLTTDEESQVDGSTANVYDEDDFDEDEIVVWFNGLSGERLSRVLDFNGAPYASWYDNDDGTSWLQKGLYQVHPDWYDADSEGRRDLKSEGKAPRVARLPILRTDVTGEEIVVDLSRFQGGRAYEVNVFDADDFDDEIGLEGEIPRDSNEYVDDVESQLGMAGASERFEDSPNEDQDDVIDEFDRAFYMYTGAGWQDEPGNWTPSYQDFEVDPGTTDEDQVAAQYDTFAKQVADQIPDGMTPEETYDMDDPFERLIEKNSGRFIRTPSPDEIRERVYEEVAWLDADELGDNE